jgi:hypothetical protein
MLRGAEGTPRALESDRERPCLDWVLNWAARPYFTYATPKA